MADAQIDGELRSGDFERAESHFRDWVGVDPRSGAEGEFPVQAGRYHLYVALACPWCHRTAIPRELAGLTDAVWVSYLAPFRDERGWAFSGEPDGLVQGRRRRWPRPGTERSPRAPFATLGCVVATGAQVESTTGKRRAGTPRAWAPPIIDITRGPTERGAPT